MTNVKTVLADVDPGDGDQLAIRRAHQLAAASGASVYLLLTAYDQSLTGGVLSDRNSVERARDEYLARLGTWLEEQASPLKDDGIAVRTEVLWHSPRYDSTLSRASELHADVIVRAAHRDSRLGRLLFAASDWELVRRAPQPVWVVKTPADLGVSGARVLAAVDPAHPNERQGDLDRKLAAAASRIVKLFGGAAHLFHAWNPAANVAPVAGAAHHAAVPALAVSRELIEELREQRQEQLELLARDFEVPAENTHLVADDIRSAVEKLVDELGIDVVVTGAVARGRLERLLIGSTAERLLDNVECDVVVIKPGNFPAR